jgi:hypothetical protein
VLVELELVLELALEVRLDPPATRLDPPTTRTVEELVWPVAELWEITRFVVATDTAIEDPPFPAKITSVDVESPVTEGRSSTYQEYETVEQPRFHAVSSTPNMKA